LGNETKMIPRLLTKDEFKSLLSGSVKNITGKEPEVSPVGVIDITPYVAAIASEDLEGHLVPDGLPVEVVYRTSPQVFDLVHVMTDRKNVYLVVVVDVQSDNVLAHHLLNLNKEYGLE
jgi:hypothetical protein